VCGTFSHRLNVSFVVVDIPQDCEDKVIRLSEPDIEFLSPQKHHFRTGLHKLRFREGPEHNPKLLAAQ
jgi:hypothetical protein